MKGCVFYKFNYICVFYLETSVPGMVISQTMVSMSSQMKEESTTMSQMPQPQES